MNNNNPEKPADFAPIEGGAIKWCLNEPGARILKEIRDGGQIKYVIRWASTTHPHKQISTIETKEDIEVDAPNLIEEFEGQRREEDIIYVPQGIVGKRMRDGNTEYCVRFNLVDSNNKMTKHWVSAETLMRDETVANMIQEFERNPPVVDDNRNDDDGEGVEEEEEEMEVEEQER